MEKPDVIYFSVNNWFCGRDYPDTPNFRKWLGDDINQNFRSDSWCKENKLCVYYGVVDMSQNYTISAPREWVEKNCPELLTDDEYTYITRIGRYVKGKDEPVYEDEEHKKKYSDFLYEADDYDRIGDMPFPEYRESNFGSHYYETYWWDDEDDEENEDSD